MENGHIKLNYNCFRQENVIHIIIELQGENSIIKMYDVTSLKIRDIGIPVCMIIYPA